MTYIKKDTWEIIPCIDDNEKDNYIEVDDLIAPQGLVVNPTRIHYQLEPNMIKMLYNLRML